MKQIIAIGGGGFNNEKSNLKIEKYLLKQVSSKSPKICFLPQASKENGDYIIKFFEAFQKLRAQPSWLSFFENVENSWKQHLLDQDIIYVGGGNTKSMLAIWKAWEVDIILKEAYDKGILLCGLSAGSICWFEQGITDSMKPLGIVDGLNFLKGSCCPHFDTEPERQKIFKEKTKNEEIAPGIALEDETAVHFIDGNLKHFIKSESNRQVFEVKQGEIKSLEANLLN